MAPKPESVTIYIAAFPAETQKALEQVRMAIRGAAPDAEESITYNMPTFKLNGKPLIYFAGYAKHIGVYALPEGNAAFKEDFARYKQGKASVQFPLNEPMPLQLITRITKYRVNEIISAGN